MLAEYPVKEAPVAEMQQVADVLDIPGRGYEQELGGVDADGGSKRLLVSFFQREETEPLEIALKGVPESGSVSVAVIGKDGFQEKQLDYADGTLKLDSADSGVYLVRF